MRKAAQHQSLEVSPFLKRDGIRFDGARAIKSGDDALGVSGWAWQCTGCGWRTGSFYPGFGTDQAFDQGSRMIWHLERCPRLASGPYLLMRTVRRGQEQLFEYAALCV